MEGTQYERAVTVLASYIIGFVTAFIAFGVTQLDTEVKFVAAPKATQSAAVVTATNAAPAAAVVPTAPAAAAEAVVMETEVGLVYVANGVETLLSLFDAAGGTDGIHAAITQYELSPDGQFVYFCEQGSLESAACTPFLYDVTSEVVYPLTQGGARIALDAEVAQLNWSANGLLSVGATGVDAIR